MNDVYLIWSNEHRRWWGPGSCGYVTRLGEAGRYTRAGALQVCREAMGTSMHLGMFSELPVREADVKEFIANGLIPGALL